MLLVNLDTQTVKRSSSRFKVQTQNRNPKTRNLGNKSPQFLKNFVSHVSTIVA